MSDDGVPTDLKELAAFATARIQESAEGRRAFDISILKKLEVIDIGFPEKLVFSYQPSEDQVNYMGTLHGGFYTTLVDVCSTIHVAAAHESRTSGVSVGIDTQYLASAPPSHLLKIDSRLRKRGKRLIFIQVYVYGIDPETKKETLLVTATHTKTFTSEEMNLSKL